MTSKAVFFTAPCSLHPKVVCFYLPMQPRLIKKVTLPRVERRLFELQSREKSVFSMYLPVERSLPLQNNDRTLFSACICKYRLGFQGKKINFSRNDQLSTVTNKDHWGCYRCESWNLLCHTVDDSSTSWRFINFQTWWIVIFQLLRQLP